MTFLLRCYQSLLTCRREGPYSLRKMLIFEGRTFYQEGITTRGYRRSPRPFWDLTAALPATMMLLLVATASGGTLTGSVRCGAENDANAVIFLESSSLPQKPKPPEQPVVLDQIRLTFVPHVLPVLVGTTVAFVNSDELKHNVFSSSKVKLFNLGTYPRGVSRSLTFEKPGTVMVLCNVHLEMSAYVVVLETPYFALSDQAGRFSIRNVPPGQYTVKTWHESLKPVTAEITIQGNETVSLELRLNQRR